MNGKISSEVRRETGTGTDLWRVIAAPIIWALVVWTVAHLCAGLVMQAYCLARSLWRKLTPEYDADLWNVTLYWHFAGFCALLTALVIGGFPRLA